MNDRHQPSGLPATLGDDLAKVYAAVIVQLHAAVANWEPPSPTARATRSSSGNGITARCECTSPRKFRMGGIHAAEDLAEHAVICSVCRNPFAPTAQLAKV